ncbi:MAG: hypothetical protein ACFE9R_18415 [Candidatus Hermodarchaeota archaeon]
MKILLDNDILIKKYYGSSSEKEKIEEIIKNNNLFILNLTLSEFKRTVIRDLVFFYNDLIKFYTTNQTEVKNDFQILKDFLLNYKRDYGVHAKGRFKGYIVLIYDTIINNFELLSNIQKMDFILELLKSQIQDYREIYIKNINLIEDAINCEHNIFEPVLIDNKFEQIVVSCIDCEKEKLTYIFNKYKTEISLILRSNISNKIVDCLKYISDLEEFKYIKGSKHVCINLFDLFLILNCPYGFTIFTSNYLHFNEFCNLLKKPAIYLN